MLMKYAQSINLQVHFSPQKRNRRAQAHTRYSELLHVSTMRTIATQTMTVNRLNTVIKGIAPSSSVVTQRRWRQELYFSGRQPLTKIEVAYSLIEIEVSGGHHREGQLVQDIFVQMYLRQ